MMFLSAFALASPAGRRSALSILIFHRVLPEPDPLFPAEVDSGQFDAMIGWVKKWFTVLPLHEAVQRLKQGDLPAAAASITFDDGYVDNHDIALPILQNHGLTATFFIATGFLDGGRMFNDTVIESVRRCSQPGLDLTRIGLGMYDTRTLSAKRQAIPNLLNRVKHLDPIQRLETVSAIAEIAGVVLPDNLMMTSPQVKALHQAGMSIGAHTVRHPIVANLAVDEAEREIADSRDHLESLLGERVTLFAYPNGKPTIDYRYEQVEIVRRMGFTAAVSTAWGVAKQDSDCFQLPRFTPWERQKWRFGLSLARNYWRKPAMAIPS
jgi:peptidoglycan/xylan/chitin deacetylase (PgdA/CDA1 family)